MKEHWTLAIFVTILLAVFLLGPTLGASIYSRFAPAGSSSDFAVENQALKAQLAELASLRKDIPNDSAPYKAALIYSRYPFNFKNEIVINSGSKDGISVGEIVGVASQATSSRSVVFLGSVKQVFENSASVRTIFDPDFQAAVKIGSGVDALLKGGTDPKLTMIPKDSTIASGDAVYSVSPDLPYGIALGQVDKVSYSKGQFFTEATLKLPYDLNTLKVVSIIPSVK